MALSGQDWETVVFHKKNGVGASTPAPQIEVQRRQPARGDGRKLDEETEQLSHARVSKTVSQRITELRLAKQWTQANLAQMMNEQPATIRAYENGSAIPNPTMMAKLARALGVPSLRTPK